MGHWGQTTLRTQRWGQRHWGQAMLRTDNVEDRRRWGQATFWLTKDFDVFLFLDTFRFQWPPTILKVLRCPALVTVLLPKDFVVFLFQDTFQTIFFKKNTQYFSSSEFASSETTKSPEKVIIFKGFCFFLLFLDTFGKGWKVQGDLSFPLFPDTIEKGKCLKTWEITESVLKQENDKIPWRFFHFFCCQKLFVFKSVLKLKTDE